ncbi:hypothetical protein HORIV_59070 [Vreelandella olivaria]|uniref:ABC transporter domain-containing protein n=1 Tax=Vreelandella olivaria TaxID=390919 RepID=A0ABM7GS69_9GAMM|nr:hypothetical protein HORIV_59070 [Halomonas olivaria]
MRERSRAALAELETHVDPRARVKDLSTSDQQMVEIAKAITRDVRVLIMDEPTATLTENEVKVLFALIDRLRQRAWRFCISPTNCVKLSRSLIA